jgi:hypothetical protein
MDYLEGRSPLSSPQLPTEQEHLANARNVKNQQMRIQNRLQSIGRAFLVFFSLLIIQLLECCFPWWLKRAGDSERGSQTRGQYWREVSRAYIHTYTRTIFLWIFYFLGALLIVGAFLMFYPRIDPQTRERLRRSEKLMKHCVTLEERDEVLRSPAVQLANNAIKSGTLPCGTPISRLVKELIDLHRLHPEDGHQCLTAKHLGYPYAIISKLNFDGTVEVMINPDKLRVIDDGKVMTINLTSDFFPLAPPVIKTRPMSAWISYLDVEGEHQRPRADGKTLHCILDAYEILTGQHYRFFSPRKDAAAAAATVVQS